MDDAVVLRRIDGSGWFTTARPDRTYKTKKGAYQAQRLFLDPSMQIQNRFYLEKIGDKEVIHEKPIEFYNLNYTPEPPIANSEPPISENTENTTEEKYKDPETKKEYILKNDSSYGWDSLNDTWKGKINEVSSDYETKNEFIGNGWKTVHLSSFFEDAQDKYPQCPWGFKDIIDDLAYEGDISEVVEEEKLE